MPLTTALTRESTDALTRESTDSKYSYERLIEAVHARDGAVAAGGYGLLKAGDLREGFRAWETRFLDPGYLAYEGIPQQGTWPLHVPRWDGLDGTVGADRQRLAGKTILLWTEQGFGDAIQFIRYAPLVAELGARVIVGCQPELKRLFNTGEGISRVYSLDELSEASYDYHAPVLSLPYLFGTTLETIPRTVPYLGASEGMAFAEGGASHGPVFQGPGVKVGLVWAGNPRQSEDASRSMHLRTMLPLLNVPGVHWYSLQVGTPSRQIHELGVSEIVHDLGSTLKDFSDTGGVINELDLVVTVDTSVAHLAGALGKRVWILLAYDADWRWMQGSTSPWYPTARLFRQQAPSGRQAYPGDWGPVIEAVRHELNLVREAAISAQPSAAQPSTQKDSEASPFALVPQCVS